MSKLAYFRCHADNRIYVFEEPAKYTAGWTKVTEKEYQKQQQAIAAPAKTTTLAEIRAAVAEYQKCADEYNRVFNVEPEIATDYEKRRADDSLHSEVMRVGRRIDWLTDLLAIAEAAEKVDTYRLFVYASAYHSDYCVDQECKDEVDAAVETMGDMITALAKVKGE